jgi:hypothetical protein
MIVKLYKSIVTICILFLIVQCSNNSKQTKDVSNTDTIIPSQKTNEMIQTFVIDLKTDNVIEGKNGTVIVIPKGSFKNSKGDIVTKNVNIELIEALSLDDMILANLTTTSNKTQLETDGMIKINAKSNNEILTINKDIPIHIEIPTNKKKNDMMVYKGIVDDKGKINWTDPKKLEKYLIPINLKLLDFLPDSFQLEVERGMPYKKYTIATQELIDSLYYSLSVSNGDELVKDLQPTKYNEAYYNSNKKVVKGKYTKESFVVGNNKKQTKPSESNKNNDGIDPAIIKVIKSEKFQNTLISTREFETRLKMIFKTCNNSVLEMYIKNLNKNLFELDSIAAKMLRNDPNYQAFVGFSNQKLTNVENANIYTELLKGFYEKQLTKVKQELESNKNKLIKALENKNKDFEEVANEYRKVLWKREKYRMERYGFNWTDTGWVNIDRGTNPKSWYSKPLEISVSNGKEFETVYTYVIYTSIKSLYRLNTLDNVVFFAGDENSKTMLMPRNKQSIIIAVGYQKNKMSFSIKEFVTGSESKFTLALIESKIDNFKDVIKPYLKYTKENNIEKDLEYMTKFYAEEKRQKALQKEKEFINHLWRISFPCYVYPEESAIIEIENN